MGTNCRAAMTGTDLKTKRERWKAWATLRLRVLPVEQFHWAVLLIAGGFSATFVTKWLLAQSDRGDLQRATFHTLRTYLTPLHNWFAKPTCSCPDYFLRAIQEARAWLALTDETTKKKLAASTNQMRSTQRRQGDGRNRLNACS